MPKHIDHLVKNLMMKPLLKRMDKREASIAATAGSYSSDPESPERFHIMREAMKRGDFQSNKLKSPHMVFSLTGIFRSIRDLKRNPPAPSYRGK
jgi:hypothetical protein